MVEDFLFDIAEEWLKIFVWYWLQYHTSSDTSIVDFIARILTSTTSCRTREAATIVNRQRQHCVVRCNNTNTNLTVQWTRMWFAVKRCDIFHTFRLYFGVIFQRRRPTPEIGPSVNIKLDTLCTYHIIDFYIIFLTNSWPKTIYISHH